MNVAKSGLKFPLPALAGYVFFSAMTATFISAWCTKALFRYILNEHLYFKKNDQMTCIHFKLFNDLKKKHVF